ncbi:hypothetical protein [Dokdonella immobilis]|uniref:Uncharacterized protein n=1 Tax=Dokdonella immobilis TaxID=578942 RepID=A0A1I4ZRC0_9GAMM|nr:hypothetical protein [Dokdonella immobilis]SFN52772.1 hypothetical protein SAMN05216289_12818 [Dokdonella immobilis]
MSFFADHVIPAVRTSLRPSMRLFLSADIVGSTAYKQRQSDSERWFSVVMRFYRDAEGHFLKQWQSRAARASDPAVRTELFGDEPPQLWKTIGDEVVFTQRVEQPWQVASCVDAWIEALNMMRDELTKEDASLDVKSSAWLADFPLRNREVGLRVTSEELEEPEDLGNANQVRLAAYYGGKAGFVRDFIGPSIDTGFRIGTLASPRRLAISLELAHVLSGVYGENLNARSMPAQVPKVQAPRFFYDGADPLKGVMGGVPYPRFWLHVGEDPLHEHEDALLGRFPAPVDIVNRYTSGFIQQYPEQFCAGLPWWMLPVPASYRHFCAGLLDQLAREEARLAEAEVVRARETRFGLTPDEDPEKLLGPEFDLELRPQT